MSISISISTVPDIPNGCNIDTILDGWKIEKFITSSQAEIYNLTNTGKPDRILKFGRNDALNDAKYAKLAGIIGVGPIVYSTVIFNDEKEKQDKEKEAIAYIVMQKLSGPILAEIYPVSNKILINALKLYYKFVVETGTVQNDFHSANLMFDSTRLYLIDYGSTKPLADKKDKGTLYKEMRKAAIQLIDHIMNVGTSFNDWKHGSLSDKTIDWLILNETAEQWLTKTFPKFKPSLLFRKLSSSFTSNLNLDIPGVAERVSFKSH